jgi:hypothetical protein
MRFWKVYPDVKNVRMDEWFYRCDCGETLSVLSPRE